MHLRTATTKSNGKVYRYVQLVESYRRSRDGMPATRVVANLGKLPPETVANLKTALDAARAGKSVVLAGEQIVGLKPVAVQANLRYLDLAVALALWRQWSLPELIDELLDLPDVQVRAADVIAALVLQRCVAPGSKLLATRWFPKTALPQLLGIAPAQFNNSRIHRVLEALDRIEDKLQSRFATLCSAREGTFATLFIDVTDTWFEGQGPALAEKGRTKDGMFRQRIGIVLLCNEHGYPLRWRVVAGKRPDSQCMGEMLDGIAACSWVGHTPMVFDRSMGQASAVEKLIRSGLRFITMVPVNEINTYTGEQHAFDALATLEVTPGEKPHPSDIQRAAQAAEQAGMECIIKERRYVLDLGILEIETNRTGQRGVAKGLPRTARLPLSPRRGLQLAQQLHSELNAPEAPSQAQLGALHGYSRQFVTSLFKLLSLPQDLQGAIRAGKADSLSLRSILAVAWLHEEHQQRSAFEELLRKRRSSLRQKARSRPSPLPRAAKHHDAETIHVRAVLTFNPEICVEQRLEAERHLGQIHDFVGKLNQRLQSPHSNRSEASIYRLINGKLERRNLIGVFGVQLHRRDSGSRKFWEVELQFKSKVWARQRSHDGFFLLVADPDLSESAAELVGMYYAKDKVEKDFQVIKSLVHLRPVRHHTDPKVRAHVTLCMLALLLDRTLERALADTPLNLTAAAAFEILDTCHLNRHRMPTAVTPLYSITELTAEQRALLTALNLEHLGDHELVNENITAR